MTGGGKTKGKIWMKQKWEKGEKTRMIVKHEGRGREREGREICIYVYINVKQEEMIK